MATTTIEGNGGDFSFAAFKLKPNHWLAVYDDGLTDVSGYPDGGYHSFRPTCRRFTMTASGVAISSAGSPLATIQADLGLVTLPNGYGIKVESWGCDIIVVPTDDTGFTDAGWFSGKPCSAMLRASVAGTAILEDPLIPTATFFGASSLASDTAAKLANVVLQGTTGCKITVPDARIATAHSSRPYDGKMDVALDLVSNLGFDLTWTAGTEPYGGISSANPFDPTQWIGDFVLQEAAGKQYDGSAMCTRVSLARSAKSGLYMAASMDLIAVGAVAGI